MSILEEIVARTRADLAQRKRDRPLASLVTEPSERDFAGALRQPGLSLIAEFKPRSPSRGALRPDARPEDIAAIYSPRAQAMSVLCDAPYFGGSYATLARVRAATDLPLIAKDFVVDPYQIHEARAHGADAVLLMASVLSKAEIESFLAVARSLGMDALVETHDEAELAVALALDAPIVGVNSRDLKTLQIDLDRACGLLRQIPAARVRVAESGITSPAAVAQVRPFADATLVGSQFMAAEDPAAAMEALGWT